MKMSHSSNHTPLTLTHSTPRKFITIFLIRGILSTRVPKNPISETIHSKSILIQGLEIFSSEDVTALRWEIKTTSKIYNSVL